MFICILTYTASLDDVNAVRGAHLEYLKAQHEAGHYLGWGRQKSGLGGVVLAKGEDRAAIEALAANDPYILNGVATVAVIDMHVAFLSPDFVADVTA